MQISVMIIEITVEGSQKLNMDLSKGPAISILCIYLKVPKSVYKRATSILLFIIARLTKVKT